MDIETAYIHIASVTSPPPLCIIPPPSLLLTDLVRAVVSGEGASRLPNAVAGTHQQQRGQKGEPNVSEGVRKSDPIPTDENYPPVKGFLVQHVD